MGAWVVSNWQRVAFMAIVLASVVAVAVHLKHRNDLEAEVERGRYLVEAVMACDSCHTPRGPTGFDMTRRFAGGTEVWDNTLFRVRGSNISADAETGIGDWSDAQLKRLLTEGVRPDGTRVAAQMPWALYRALSTRDLDAVVRFVKTVPSIRNRVEPPIYKKEGYAGPSLQNLPPIGPSHSDPVIQRGAYLGSLAYCMACHARRPDGAVDLINSAGKGGFRMVGTFGEVTVPNITSDPAAGIASWSDAEIHRALFEGTGRDGRRFKLPMAREVFYRQMTPKDKLALVAWVRSLPAR